MGCPLRPPVPSWRRTGLASGAHRGTSSCMRCVKSTGAAMSCSQMFRYFC